MNNEAAERLRVAIRSTMPYEYGTESLSDLDEALRYERRLVPDDQLGYLHDGQWFPVDPAAERRATVNEINRLIGERHARTYEEVTAILDKVAAR